MLLFGLEGGTLSGTELAFAPPMLRSLASVSKNNLQIGYGSLYSQPFIWILVTVSNDCKTLTPFGWTKQVAVQSEFGIVSVNQDYSDKEVFQWQIQGLFLVGFVAALTNEVPVRLEDTIFHGPQAV